MLRGLRHLQVGMALGDLKTRVQAADAGYAALLGRDASELAGLTMHDITHTDDRACTDHMLAMLHATRQPFCIVKRYLVADQPVWVENLVSWLGGEGDDGRLIVLSRKLTEAEVRRPVRTLAEAEMAAVTAEYVHDMADQLTSMADRSRLPTTAVALRMAGMLMQEEHEDLPAHRR